MFMIIDQVGVFVIVVLLKIFELFYVGVILIVFDMLMVGKVIIEEGEQFNGNLILIDEEMGLVVSKGLLVLYDDFIIKFVFGYEFGYGISLYIFSQVGLEGISGQVIEVIVDLSVVYIFVQFGSIWDVVIGLISIWCDMDIFDVYVSGYYLLGDECVVYVWVLQGLIGKKMVFKDVVYQICNLLLCF